MLWAVFTDLFGFSQIVRSCCNILTFAPFVFKFQIFQKDPNINLRLYYAVSQITEEIKLSHYKKILTIQRKRMFYWIVNIPEIFKIMIIDK